MTIQERIDSDLKAAMLGGDKTKAETLRGLKNSLQYEKINLGQQDKDLTDEQATKVLARESKKRAEAADLYKQGGNDERAATELAEKAVIDGYLPEQADDSAIKAAVEAEIAKLESPTPADMGKVIGSVKAKFGSSADGATVARIVKEKLSQ